MSSDSAAQPDRQNAAHSPAAAFEALLLDPTSPMDRALLEPPTPEKLQKQLPQYEIVKMLGRGGMGAVYLGKQLSLERPVAIKVLPPHLEDEEAGFVERFKNEAKAMARLNHPGIVAVYDFGQTAEGLLYIAMELVEGTDVQRMITQKGRLKSAHAHAITAHVCDALAYAHERGLIHRDIKPANIMLSQDGDVKVADFGLAKALNTNATNLTQSGMVMGTLHYMAPESFILGAAVDHRADIYAVGVMLYQMLTGRVPSGVFELPSLQIPGLDPRFDDIITRAMREERNERYQSAREMRHDLDGMLTRPLPVKIAPPAATPKVESSATKALPQATRPNAPLEEPPPKRGRFRPAKQRAVLGWGLATLLLLACCVAYLWLTGVRVTFEDASAPLEPVASTATAPPIALPEPQPIKPVPVVPPPASSNAAKPAPVATPTPPAVTMTPPVAPATLDFSEYQQLNTAHAAIWQQHVRQPYDDGLALLSSQFVQALERGMLTPDPMKKAAFAGELQRFKADAQPPPASADADPALPAQITQYRQTFRLQAARLEQARDLAAAGVTKEFLDALAALEKSQSANQQPGRAAGVKALHADLLAGRKAVTDVLITTNAVATAKPASAPGTTAASQLSLPDGTLKTGGRLVFEDNFDSGVLSADWTQQDKAWYCVTGLLGTSESFLKNTKDKGWGCWLRRDLPEYARIEFDVDFVGRGALMVCELYATPPNSTASPAGTGYKLMFGEKNAARPVIQRGMTPLVSGGVNTKPVTASTESAHHIIIQRVDGQTLEWFIDGSLHARARDGDPKRGGWLGFQYQDGMALIDNVKVYDLDPQRITAPVAAAPPPPAPLVVPPVPQPPAAAVGQPNGTAATGGALVFEDLFTPKFTYSKELSSEWLDARQPVRLSKTRFDHAWGAFEGALHATAASLREAADQGFGCWLLRPLPERMRIEFDAEMETAASSMVCEFYVDTPTAERSPKGSGYSVVFGGNSTALQKILRGTNQLPSTTTALTKVKSTTKNTYHMIIQRVDGRTIEWLVDGQMYATGRDDSPKTTGHLGFQFRGDTVRYDNLRIYDLDSTSPVTPVPPPTPVAAVKQPSTVSEVDAITDLAGMTAYIKKRNSSPRLCVAIKVNAPPGISLQRIACAAPRRIILNQHGVGWVYLLDTSTSLLTVMHPGCLAYEETLKRSQRSGIIEREITLVPLDPQQSCMCMGQVLTPAGKPAANAIVRLADWAWMRTDDLGRFAFQNVSPGNMLARAESPEGEWEMPVTLKAGSTEQLELPLKKAETIGIRWTLQTQPDNMLLTGPGVETGEAYFSLRYRSLDLERGTSHTGTNYGDNDVTFYEDKQRYECSGEMHLAAQPYDQLTVVNQLPVNKSDRTPLKTGQVFLLKTDKRTHAKIEITHLPDK